MFQAHIQAQSVVIYENSNFGGRAKILDIGEHRLSDFNNLALSIKVPIGLAVLIYEHADGVGGYGIWVDFLEDQPDLSIYGFNDKVSYVVVFNTQNRGLIWVRNSMQNGQFVAGHWERARVGGNPVNSIPVVAPPLPPHTPISATVTQVNDAQTTITSLDVQSVEDAATWAHAETDLMGVIGSDFRGIEEIGSAAFERASNNIAIPDSINFWYPQKQPRDHRRVVYFKRTLSGLIDAEEEPYIVDIDGTYKDHDFTLHILPSPKYMYLITDGHAPELSTMEKTKLVTEGKDTQKACTEPFKLVEAEIDTGLSAKNMLNSLVRQRIGKQIAVYGTWIYDKGHCHQPEIHPAEQIWWSENVGTNKQYNLNVFCDSSQRFWWRRQMDDGTKLKPWGAPPIKGTFAIAFEVEISQPNFRRHAISRPAIVRPGKQFQVSNIDHYNVTDIPNSNKVYNLVYQDRTLVSFVPCNNAFKVSYEKVGLKPGTTNIVRGFLVIETTVGIVTQIATNVESLNIPQGTDPNKVPEDYEERVFKKEDGHYMFSILQTDIAVPTRVGHMATLD